MATGVTVNEFLDVGLSVSSYMNLGLVLSAMFLPFFHLVQKLTGFLGLDPIEYDIFQKKFDHGFEFLFGAVLPSQQASDHSSKRNLYKSHAMLGILVVAVALILEVVMLVVVVGVGFGGYYLVGASIDLTAAYLDVVSLIVFLTLVCMSYGELKIKETARYT